MQNAGLDEAQAGIKIARRNINNLTSQMTPPLWQKAKKKNPDDSETGVENVSLKLNIQKTKIMASGPITPWEIDGETMERLTDFCFFLAPISLQMVTAAMKLKDACSLKVEKSRVRQPTPVLLPGKSHGR